MSGATGCIIDGGIEWARLREEGSAAILLSPRRSRTSFVSGRTKKGFGGIDEESGG